MWVIKRDQKRNRYNLFYVVVTKQYQAKKMRSLCGIGENQPVDRNMFLFLTCIKSCGIYREILTASAI